MGFSYREDYYDESRTHLFKEWMQQLSNTHKQLLEEKALNDLIQEAFLEGFRLGKKRKDKENWDLWNQK